MAELWSSALFFQLSMHGWGAAAPLLHGGGWGSSLGHSSLPPRLAFFRVQLEPASLELCVRPAPREMLNQKGAEYISYHSRLFFSLQSKAAFPTFNLIMVPPAKKPKCPLLTSLIVSNRSAWDASFQHWISPLHPAWPPAPPSLNAMDLLPPAVAPSSVSLFPPCPHCELKGTSSQMPSRRMTGSSPVP